MSSYICKILYVDVTFKREGAQRIPRRGRRPVRLWSEAMPPARACIRARGERQRAPGLGADMRPRGVAAEHPTRRRSRRGAPEKCLFLRNIKFMALKTVASDPQIDLDALVDTGNIGMLYLPAQ